MKCFLETYNNFGSALIKIIEIATPFILFIIGVKKVNEALEIYITRKRDAIYDYYPRLRAYLVSLEYFITVKEPSMKPGDVIRKIWLYRPPANPIDVSSEEIEALHKACEEFITFFKTCPNQVPPHYLSKDKHSKWYENINLLQAELRKLSYDTLENAKRNVFKTDDVLKKHKTIQDLIDYFMVEIKQVDEGERPITT